MAAGPDDIRGLIPFTLASLVLGQSLGFVQSPVSTGLHHAMVTLPKLKNLTILWWVLNRLLTRQRAPEPDNLPS
jgi:hypothetical protein